MKELTIEEKAKAYDKAIERAIKHHNHDGLTLEQNETIDIIFPELKEKDSENERIRKEIIKLLRNWASLHYISKEQFSERMAWLEKQRDKDKLIQELGEYKVKYTQEVLEKYINSMSNKDDERLRKTAIAFLKDFAEQGYENAVECIDWLEKQGEQAPSQTNERAWLYLVSDVLTWKEGIGQYLDDPRVQELAKKLCSEYAQKLYNPSVLSNSSNTGKNEQKSADKIEPRFKVGDWVVNKFGDSWHIDSLDKKNYQISDGKGNYNYFPISKQDEMRIWTIQDAKDGDIIQLDTVTAIFKKYIGREKCICYCSFCKNGGFEIPIENWEDNVYGCYNATPATREHRDYLMNAMNNAGYEWDIEKKELKKKR